jgi:hypothetical protein
MSIPNTITLPPHLRGDTWDGLNITLKTDNGTPAPLDLTDASAKMQLKTRPGARDAAAEWSTEDNSIVITDALNGVLSVPGGVVDVPPCNYFFDLQITLADATVLTPFSGRWLIIQDVSQ